MLSVYLASQYHLKNQTRQCAQDLRTAGIECTSVWLNEPHDPTSRLVSLHENLKAQYAEQDLSDIQRADVFVVFSVPEDQPILRGGMVFETGYAHGIGKPIIVCGQKQHIFCWLSKIQQVESWSECLALLKQTADRHK
jgi:nucleoside 2-deoxyribosyltransferase